MHPILSLSALLGVVSNPSVTPPVDVPTIEVDPARLNAALRFQGGGVDIGALIRSSYARVDEDLVGGADDIGGWVFQDVDVWLEGEVGDFDWRVNVDFDDSNYFDQVATGAVFGDNGAANDAALAAFADLFVLGGGGQGGDGELEDAFIRFSANENIDIQWGRFKAPTLLSNQVDPEKQLFITRSILGSVFDVWDMGGMASGRHEQFGWNVALQNGGDGANDELRMTLRGELHLNGAPVAGQSGRQGSIGAPDDLQATFGLTFLDDQGIEEIVGEDATAIALDAAATMGQLSGQFELAMLDDGLGDATPFALQVGYLFDPQWEGGVRYEILDNDIDATVLTAAVNYYLNGGKATLQLANVDSDGAVDGTVIQLGISVGRTRK